MRRALFITIGTRDIQIDKSRFIEMINPEDVKKVYRKNKAGVEQIIPRNAGLLIKDHIQELKKFLKYPIIRPFLEYLQNNGSPDFERVYLVTTNQNQEEAREFYDNDTIHFAEILKSVLPGIYKAKLEKIDILQVKKDVIFIDSMFNHFNEVLGTKPFELISVFNEVHILNQGGIDAINYGLLINALYLYGGKIKLYNVSEKNQLCTPLNFGMQFELEQEKNRIRMAMNRYDYAYIKNSTIEGDLKTWAAYAEARLNFDFDVADSNASRISINREYSAKERSDLSNIKNNTDRLTSELFWNALIKYKQESYVDFIQRFFRIVEQYAQQKALSYMKNFNYDPKSEHMKWFSKITQYLEKEENQGLRDFLDTCILENGHKLELKSANIPVFMQILKYYNEKEYDFINKIEPLSKIRNKGIGAHGFDPISLDVILNKLSMNKNQFEKTLKELGKKLKVSTNPFERINKYIEESIN